MEETIKKLKQFFNEIAWAETEADQFKNSIFAIHGAKRKIFVEIDKECKREITSTDICSFCSAKGIKTNQQTSQVIGRYFRNWNQGIDYQQFSQIIQPKTSSRVTNLQTDDPLKIFTLLVHTVIKSFENLQVLRQGLVQCFQQIIDYFQNNYYGANSLNKQNLKQFLINENIYSRAKYSQICAYIFGEMESQIPWKNLFNIKKQSTELEKIPLKQSFSVYDEQQKNQKAFETKRPEVQKLQFKDKDCNNIHDVLNQIAQIQQHINLKKQRTGKSEQETLMKETKQKQSLIGKVVSQSQNVSRKNIGQQENRKTKPIKNNNYFAQIQNHEKLGHKYYNDTPNSSYTIEKGLKRVTSEAQMKINEIERRAMDKYLSTRRESHLPNDHHVPYFYSETRDAMEFVRERSLQRLETGILSRNLSRQNLYMPIYSRNKVSRVLYSDGGFMHRAVSPHLMRY